MRATQATFKSTSAQQRTTANYRNGNRSWPRSLELITLPSPSKLVWLACKAPSATPVWNLPLTMPTEADTGRPKTPIHFRGPYPDVPSIALRPLSRQADNPSRGDAAVRKWTGVAPSAVMQTYPLSPPCDGIPLLTSRGQTSFPTPATPKDDRNLASVALPKEAPSGVGRQYRLPVAAVNRATGESRKNLFTCGSQPSQQQNRSEAFSVVGRWWPLLAAPDFFVLTGRFWERNRKMSDTRTFFDPPRGRGHRRWGNLFLPPLIGDVASFATVSD